MIQLDDSTNDLNAQVNAICREIRTAEAEDRDRRGCHRFSYPSVQAIAPCDGIQFPSRQSFSVVRCHDISQGGLSFLWSAPVDFPYIIVKLDRPTESVYLMAEIKRCEPVAGLKETFLVGCRFLSRVKL